MRSRITQMGIDHQALFAPLTKKTTRLTQDGARDILLDAAQVATSGRRGPVHVGLPTDLSGKDSIGVSRPMSRPPPRPPPIRP